MALNLGRYTRLINAGFRHEQALLAADPATDTVESAAVADVAAMTQAAITGGESPTEAEFNALRDDVAAVRTTVNALLASLRAGGVILP